MATPNQIAANQQNAQNSTGPRTEAGKARSAQNRRSHGLCGTIQLSEEEQARFDELRDDLMGDYDPRDRRETEMVERLAESAWRMRLLRTAENCFYNKAMEDLREETGNPDLIGGEMLAHMFLDKQRQGSMRLFLRYQSAIERAYYKALADCEAMLEEHARHDAAALVMSSSEAAHNQSVTPDWVRTAIAAHTNLAAPPAPPAHGLQSGSRTATPPVAGPRRAA